MQELLFFKNLSFLLKYYIFPKNTRGCNVYFFLQNLSKSTLFGQIREFSIFTFSCKNGDFRATLLGFNIAATLFHRTYRSMWSMMDRVSKPAAGVRFT